MVLNEYGFKLPRAHDVLDGTLRASRVSLGRGGR